MRVQPPAAMFQPPARAPTPQGGGHRIPTPQAQLHPSQLLPPQPPPPRMAVPSPGPRAPSPAARAPSPAVRAPSPLKPPLPPAHTPSRSEPAPVPKPVTDLALLDETVENISLEQFKEFVRKWIDLDKTIKVAQETLREKKKLRDKLAAIIQKFMCKYNIEDLNTKEGKIRCKVRQVKAPITQTEVKQKLQEIFSHDERKKEEVLGKIYNTKERPRVEKVSLRRLKITNA